MLIGINSTKTFVRFLFEIWNINRLKRYNVFGILELEIWNEKWNASVSDSER